MSVVATIVLTGLSLIEMPKASASAKYLNAYLVSAPAVATRDTTAVIPQHVAFVRFDMANLDTSPGATTRTPDLIFRMNGRDVGVVFLKDEILTTRGEVTDPIQANGDKAKIADQFQERLPLANVQKFNDICNSCGGPDDTLNSSTDLGARIHLLNGRVASSHLQNQASKFCQEADPTNQCQPGINVRLPQQVTIDMALNTNRLVLDSSDANGNAKPEKALWFRSATDFEILIGSAPLDDIEELHWHTDELVDYHFENYYRVLKYKKSNPKEIYLPVVPVKFVSGANCPPMLYEVP